MILECLFWAGDVSDEELRRRAQVCADSPALTETQRVPALVDLAELTARLGDEAGARAVLERALKLAPGDPQASRRMAELLRGEPEKALPHAERAGAHRLVAEIQLDLGDKKKARAALEIALQQSPDDLDALGVAVALEKDRPKEAAAYASRACDAAARQPRWLRPAALRRCALLHEDLGDAKAAAAQAALALADAPNDLDTWRVLMRLKRRNPELPPVMAPKPSPEAAGDDEALKAEDVERLTRDSLRLPAWQRGPALRRIAAAWFRLGKPARALQSGDFTADLEDWPSDVRAKAVQALTGDPRWRSRVEGYFEELSAARLALGDPAGAEADLLKGLERVPGGLQLMTHLAYLKDSQKKRSEAAAWTERLVAAADARTLEDIVALKWKGDPGLEADLDAGMEFGKAAGRLLKDPAIAAHARRYLEKDRQDAREVRARITGLRE